MRGGLRAQFLLGLTVLMIAALGLFVLVTQRLGERQVRQAALEQATRAAQILAASPALANGGGEAVGEAQLEAWRQRADLEAVAVLRDGALERAVGPAALRARAPELSAAAHAMSLGGALEFEGRGLAFAQAFLPGGRGDRRVLVLISMEPALVRQGAAQKIFWLYVLVDALLVIVLGYSWLSFAVLRPLRAISVATERAAAGDLASPIELRPRNEIGRMASSFNEMLVRLEAQRQELEAHLEELERANTELRCAQDELIRSEKLASVGQLAAGIAHEVGNPLAAVKNYTELLAEGDLDRETAADLHERVARQLNRIHTIIRELLDFSRDDGEAALSATDLAACAREAADLVRALPRARHAVLGLDHERLEALPHASAVPSQLVQILINLMVNAADALQGHSDARITVSGRALPAEEGGVALWVEDNGPGVPTDLRARVFDPFFTTKEPGQGTGLGLAVCARILDRLGGELRLTEAAPPGGARFEIVLPLHR